MNTRIFGYFLSVLAILPGLAGCGRNEPVPPPEPERPYLVVYTSHREEIFGPVIKEFEEREGVWVDVVTGGSNELLERIAGESEAPVADVLFGGYNLSHRAYADYLEPYRCADWAWVDAAWLPEDNLSTPFSLLSLVLIYHTKIVPAKSVPTGWASLLDPQWAGKIAFADPRASASSYVALTALLQAGEEDPWRILHRFAENLEEPGLGGSVDVLPSVEEGTRYPLGVALEEAAQRRIRAGADISMVYPEEGTVFLPDVSSLVKGAPHAELGKAFLDFTVSRDIQLMIATDFGRRPVRSDVNPPGWMRSSAEIALLDFDSGWSTENQARILAQWSAATVPATGEEMP